MRFLTSGSFLGILDAFFNIEEIGAQASSITESRGGNILIRLAKSDSRQPDLENALKNTPRERAVVRGLEKWVVIKITGLNFITTEEKVFSGICSKLELSAGEVSIKVWSLRASYSGTQKATISLKDDDTTKLLKKERLKIGWMFAKISRLVKATRCFRCLCYDHTQHNCKGPDRRQSCSVCIEDEYWASS
jgi:hypothetical protein